MNTLRLVAIDEESAEARPFTGLMYRFGWHKAERTRAGEWIGKHWASNGGWNVEPAGWTVTLWHRGRFEDIKKETLPARFPTKQEAIEAARADAVKRGVEYVEFSARPEPSAEETRQKEIYDLRVKVRQWDHFAQQAEDGKDFLGDFRPGDKYRQAAEYWQRSAATCLELIALEPHRTEHLKKCAISRLEGARECLNRWTTEIVKLSSVSGIRVVKAPELVLAKEQKEPEVTA